MLINQNLCFFETTKRTSARDIFDHSMSCTNELECIFHDFPNTTKTSGGDLPLFISNFDLRTNYLLNVGWIDDPRLRYIQFNTHLMHYTLFCRRERQDSSTAYTWGTVASLIVLRLRTHRGSEDRGFLALHPTARCRSGERKISAANSQY